MEEALSSLLCCQWPELLARLWLYNPLRHMLARSLSPRLPLHRRHLIGHTHIILLFSWCFLSSLLVGVQCMHRNNRTVGAQHSHTSKAASSFSFSCPSSSLPPPGRVVRPSSLSRQSSVRAGRAEKRRKKSSCQSQLEIVCSLRLSFTHSHANATHSTQISVW